MRTCRIFNAAVSHVVLCWFALQITLLFYFPTASAFPHRASANNVLDATRTLSRIRTCSTSGGTDEEQSSPEASATRENKWNNEIPHNLRIEKHRWAIFELDNSTTSADKSATDHETTTLVSPPAAESLDVGGSAATRCTARTSSSSGELTWTLFRGWVTPATALMNVVANYRRIPATTDSNAAETASAPVTHMVDPPSSAAAETDVTTTTSSTITQSQASIPSSVTSPSSEDRPFSSSTAQPGSTFQSPATSSPTSSTEQDPTPSSVASSTEDINTTATTTSSSLSTRDTSTSSGESGVSPAPSSPTAGGSAASLLPRTTSVQTIASTIVSSRSSTSLSSATHATVLGESDWDDLSSQDDHRPVDLVHNVPYITMDRRIFFKQVFGHSFVKVLIANDDVHQVGEQLADDLLSSWISNSILEFPTWSPTAPVVIPSSSSTETSSTTVTTGALRTNTASFSSFARNTGAIIGVSLAATIALVCLVLVLFFACRQYRRRRGVHNGSTDNILTLAREVSWRRPVDGDDDSYVEKPQSHPPSGSIEQSIDGTHEAYASTSAGHGSAESGAAITTMPMNTVFGGQTPMPGLGQSIQGAIALPATSILLSQPTDFRDAPHVSSNPYRHVHAGGSRSDTALTLAGELSCSHEETLSSSSTEELARKPHGKRKSLSGPRPLTSKAGHRHSSTPPSAFANAQQLPGSSDYERQTPPPEQSDRMSVRSFISRLRNGRRTSAQSMSTIRAPSYSQSREPDVSVLSSETMISPSLLNPPITISPPRPILTFPRGVTGNSYNPLSAEGAEAAAHNGSGPTAVLWPPATLPPSPSASTNSSMVEGLLHPRLGLGQGQNHQASMTSLRDHEDYSRPISGLVNNHLRSTTTFDIQDNSDVEEGKENDSIHS
ncbi:hypothetical protein BDN70DRAFT_932550 [Pholiota conissans]|uniref:Transmembrane protein n=1 Tax=Pholiota conissans TaxID=109636 RepID=A0A9P5Z3A4_9AGAR|nr:hypothetical protein BDN70DRAFT_932550 [Pholiota conissans]